VKQLTTVINRRSVAKQVSVQLPTSADNVTLLAAASAELSRTAIDRYLLPLSPQQQTRPAACSGRMMGRTDGRTECRYIDPAHYAGSVNNRAGAVHITRLSTQSMPRGARVCSHNHRDRWKHWRRTHYAPIGRLTNCELPAASTPTRVLDSKNYSSNVLVLEYHCRSEISISWCSFPN